MKQALRVLLLLALIGLGSSSAVAGGQRTIVVSGAYVGGTFAVSGCNYTKPEVSVYLYRERDYQELLGFADGAPGGCFDYVSNVVFTESGAYEVEVFQVKGTTGAGSYNQNHPAAELEFEVLP